MLTAAGTVAAFGSIYAAHALYGFIGPALAFVALGLAAVATMFAAALHGPMLAGIGLAAAMAVPLLVNSNSNSAWPVVIYIAVVAAAAYGLARLRQWLWLATAAAAGAGAWAIAFLLAIDTPNGTVIYHAALVHLVVQAAMALVILAWEPYRDSSDNDRPEFIPSVLAAGVAALALVVLSTASGRELSVLWPVASAIITALLAWCAVTRAASILAIVAAAITVVGTLLVWPWATDVAGHAAPFEFTARGVLEKPLLPASFLTFAILVTALTAAAAMWKVFRGAHLNVLTTSIFAGTAVLLPLLALLAVYLRYAADGYDMLFAAIVLVLALAFATCAQVFRRGLQDKQPLAWDLGQGISASAAIAALVIGLTLAFDGGTLTIALALSALGAAFVAVRLDIAALRWCVAGLGLVLALRFVWDPGIAPDISRTPVFNWLLPGYGIPAACFAASAWLMRRTFGEDKPVRIA